MNYNSMKAHSEANEVADNMINSGNPFVKKIGLELANAGILRILDVKHKIDTHWPDLWNKYWIKE